MATMEVIAANRLRDGAVVWLGADDVWVERIAAATVLAPDTIEAALAVAGEGLRRNQVVDITRVPVALVDGVPVPSTQREKLRALGPSVRPDLGKQAESYQGRQG